MMTKKLKGIDGLHSEQGSAYHMTIDAGTAANQNQYTIAESIRRAALALEEFS